MNNNPLAHMGEGVIFSGFAKVLVTVHVTNEIPAYQIDGDYTRIMDLHLKRIDGRWLVTQFQQIRVG